MWSAQPVALDSAGAESGNIETASAWTPFDQKQETGTSKAGNVIKSWWISPTENPNCPLRLRRINTGCLEFLELPSPRFNWMFGAFKETQKTSRNHATSLANKPHSDSGSQLRQPSWGDRWSDNQMEIPNLPEPAVGESSGTWEPRQPLPVFVPKGFWRVPPASHPRRFFLVAPRQGRSCVPANPTLTSSCRRS